MKKLLLFGTMALLLTSCADSVDLNACSSVVEEPGGFFWGFWNGMIAGWAFIGSLFNDNIAIYDVNNNGGWYDFGFVLGLGSLGTVIKSIKEILK